MSNIALWTGNSPLALPKNIDNASDVVSYAVQLSPKDKKQIVEGFNSGNYEMVSLYVLTKSFTALKRQLSKLGATFISEMLNRPDIDETTNVENQLSNYEAIRLAEDLGMISNTGAFRLRQALERVQHFVESDTDSNEVDEMTKDEAVGVIRPCIENIVGYEKIEAALDFAAFREELESKLFTLDDDKIKNLLTAPYFFQRTIIRTLLSLTKTTESAQLEHTLANINVLIPALWPKLNKPEKWQIGQTYAEIFAAGKAKASVGLRKALLKVKGFDFVPENFRSTSYIKIANDILQAHMEMHNFYNEPLPMKTLSEMGSTIPTPAFPICMSATLCVKLGNSYGISYDAQPYADIVLKATTVERWQYYLNDCLPSDDKILYKLLLNSSPLKRWIDVVQEYKLVNTSITNKHVKQLLVASSGGNLEKARDAVKTLISKLGYSVK